ncbi:unnamed protein product [Adineta ricciae]|uniref:Uncharacterized protein n=1 Tax=Adineta ricciae TaxID=249248 RepID=A0A815RBF1_ADIRI|nr:unnamed protein product [Adineta ricciae]CAF1474898.1 unnamed protein product [Adineta ricciae]
MLIRMNSYFICMIVLTDISFATISLTEEQQPSDAHFAVNSNMAVFARNRDRLLYVTSSPYIETKRQCQLEYDLLRIKFVEKIALGKDEYEGPFTYTFIGATDSSPTDYNLYMIRATKDYLNSCSNLSIQPISVSRLVSSETGYALTMHPFGKQVYIIGNGYLCDIHVNQSMCGRIGILNATNMFIKTIEVTSDKYIFIGVYSQKMNELVPELYIFETVDTSDKILIKHFPMMSTGEIPRGRATMTMSVHGSLKDPREFVLAVGIPEIDTVLIYVLTLDRTLLVKIHRSPLKGVQFGQSIFITPNRMYGVLAASLSTQPWSNSRIQFYPIPPATDGPPEIISPKPLFIYPNNQQTLLKTVIVESSSDHIVNVVGWSAGFGVVVNSNNIHYALLIPNTPPGNIAIAPTIPHTIFISANQACPLGTQKLATDFGPCVLCPPQTRNNGSSGVQCQECDKNSSSMICFRGASIEINKTDLTSYRQVQPYLNSPGSTEFDDILLNHVFKLKLPSNMRCLLLAPLFWGLLAIGIGLMLLLLMIILSFIPKMQNHRTILKRIFVRLDIIGEGQLWFGGLLTLAIITLIGFTCKFSISFVSLYPIEQVSINTRKALSCDENILNAKFSSTLQLLSTLKRAEEKPIFDLLDTQELILRVEFISTGFQCSSTAVQENLNRGHSQPINNFNCSYEQEKNSLIISSVLPQHLVTLQLTLTGPFFVGALRICLSGPEIQTHKGKYTVKHLDFCQFLYPSDQVLTVEPTISIEMTRIINRTDSVIDKDNTFSAIWLPTLTMKSALWDSHIYKNDQDEYRRSLNWQVALVVDFTQSKFYMQNVQEPIARGYEIVFKTILFSMLVLELFGLLFLMFKLLIIPLVRFIRRITCPSLAYKHDHSNIQTSNNDDNCIEDIVTSTRSMDCN